MMLSPESKATIDALTIEELEDDVGKGRYSRFSNENYAYAQARLAKLVRERQDANIQRGFGLSEESNKISRGSKGTATKALWVSAIAVIVAILVIVVPHYWK